MVTDDNAAGGTSHALKAVGECVPSPANAALHLPVGPSASQPAAGLHLDRPKGRIGRPQAETRSGPPCHPVLRQMRQHRVIRLPHLGKHITKFEPRDTSNGR
jgi:hypothetical protein